MSAAMWSLLVVMILPIVCAGISKAGGQAYDNAHPRQWLAQQQGFRARAVAAQQNSWEALILFGLAVLIAQQLAGPSEKLDGLAVAFVVCRVAYLVAYVANWALLRSLVWLAGLYLTVWIFALGAAA